MKALITSGLCAALGLAGGPAFAQDLDWRATTGTFQRVAPAEKSMGLSQPQAAAPNPVEPTSFHQTAPPSFVTLQRPTPVFRGKTPELDPAHQIMPIGPSIFDAAPGVVKPMSQVGAPRPMPKQTFTPPPPADDSVIVNNGTPFLDGCGSAPTDCCPADCCVGGWLGRRQWGSWLNGLRGCFDNCAQDACCLPRPRAWFRGEYLLWHISDADTPALLTSENIPFRPIDGGAGTLPLSPTLLGDTGTGDEVRSGFRTQFGFWFPRLCNWGMDFSGFMLLRRNNHFEASSDALGNPVLARPFFDVTIPGENAQIVSYPGEFAGRFSYDSTTRVWGVDGNFRRKLHCGPRWWLDGLIGYRHLQVNDSIDIQENITDINQPGRLLGFTVRDSFSTRNSFNGFQLGLEGEMRLWRRWFLAGNLKVAVGGVHQTLNIDGSTDFLINGGGTATGVGGLYALVSNIGRYERDQFAIVPEFGIKIGFDVTDHVRVYAGYNLLYLSNVARAGEQIDRAVNPNMLPDIVTPPGLRPALSEPLRPAVLFRDSSFWAGGAQFGLEYHW